jgi:hypothetical protein
MDTWSGGKNKANSKPIQTQFKANTNPIQTQYKAKQSQFIAASPLPKPEQIQFQRQKNVSGPPKYLTSTNMDDNFRKCTVFRLFIERTLFGRSQKCTLI